MPTAHLPSPELPTAHQPIALSSLAPRGPGQGQAGVSAGWDHEPCPTPAPLGPQTWWGRNQAPCGAGTSLHTTQPQGRHTMLAQPWVLAPATLRGRKQGGGYQGSHRREEEKSEGLPAPVSPAPRGLSPTRSHPGPAPGPEGGAEPTLTRAPAFVGWGPMAVTLQLLHPTQPRSRGQH